MTRTQVRLGLVFQGGVSLAVWMGGVAHEIDLLRRAGAPDRRDPPADGAECDGDCGGDRALCRWRALCNHLEIDVVVDVVSGTSAGGLNGAFLACAAATGNPLPPLQDLWVDAAQLQRGQLLRETGTGPLPSLLDGDYFGRRIRRVFDSALGGGHPAAHPVTLLTTATALGEQSAVWTDCTGDRFGVADHRRVYGFRHDPAAVRFDPPAGQMPADPWVLFPSADPAQITVESVAELARAARATAGFPAAFSPVDERDGDADLSPYRVRGGPGAGILVDGGVLDNTPFEPLLEEIGRRPVEGDWRRIIGYVTANDGLADSTVPAVDGAGTEVARGWFPVLTSTLRMGSETSFRNGVEALAQRSLDAQRSFAPEAAFADALDSPGRMGAAAEALYEHYRRQRVASGILDARLACDCRSGVRPVCPPAMASSDPGSAPLWVPPAGFTEAVELAQRGDWRWGTAGADRAVRVLIRHLRAIGGGGSALGELSRVLTAVTAVRDFLTAQIASAPGGDGPALMHAVNAACEIGRSPEVLGVLMRQAARAYAGVAGDQARSADEVLRAALVVEVVSHALSGPLAFSRTPRFDVVRMGPDVDAPVAATSTDPRPLGAWKLYGTQLGHFGAFGEADWRRHDFLWGRLDGAAHLIRALARVSGSPLREPETAASRTVLAQETILAQEDVTRARLAEGLQAVGSLDATATLDAIRSTKEGRQAAEDTVTDALRMLLAGGDGVPAMLRPAGQWAAILLGRRMAWNKSTALCWKIPVRAATAIWPRGRFWRHIRNPSRPPAPDTVGENRRASAHPPAR